MVLRRAACADTLRLEMPIHWRASRLHENGFFAGRWNRPERDLDALEKTGEAVCDEEAYPPSNGGIQIADDPWRFEAESGEINCPVITCILAETGCSGPVGLEAFGKGDNASAPEALRAAFTI
jgi:hydroxypyruvate isomerase